MLAKTSQDHSLTTAKAAISFFRDLSACTSLGQLFRAVAHLGDAFLDERDKEADEDASEF